MSEPRETVEQWAEKMSKRRKVGPRSFEGVNAAERYMIKRGFKKTLASIFKSKKVRLAEHALGGFLRGANLGAKWALLFPEGRTPPNYKERKKE